MLTAERAAPHNLEAETCVLGAILINNRGFNEAAAVIDGRDFFRDAHRRIFEKMGELTDRSEPVDLVTLKDELNRSGELDEVGGPAYISALTDGVPRSSNVEYYAKIVKEKATLRRLISSANDVAAQAYAGDTPAATVVERAREAFDQIGVDAPTRKVDCRTARQLIELPDTAALLADWPILALGSVAAIVGASGCGKTHLAVRVAADMARNGYRVVIFALEGYGGLRRRLQAAAIAFGLTPADLERILFIKTLSLGDPGSLWAAAAAVGFAHVAIVDTVARALGDLDENSASDIGSALNGCLRLSEMLGGAAIVLLHHTNRATASERGSSAFRAGVDALAFLEDEGEQRVLRVDKMRDSEPPPPRAFRLRAVPEAGSVVLDDACTVVSAQSEAELTAKSRDVLRELRQVGRASATELVDNLKGRVARSTVFGSLEALQRLGLAKQEGRQWVAGNSPISRSDWTPKSDAEIGLNPTVQKAGSDENAQ